MLVSIVIIAYSAQRYALSIPIVFSFVALSILKPTDSPSVIQSSERSQYCFVSALTCYLLVTASYPLAENLVVSTLRSIKGTSLDISDPILKTIAIDAWEKNTIFQAVNDLGALEKMSSLDVLAAGRATKSDHPWDYLSVLEYRDYLGDGLMAARNGCNEHARISNLDQVNPFPLLLGWPEGGGMLWVVPDELLSEKAHLDSDVMFREIDCVMIPKLPINIFSRELLLKIYWPDLSKVFTRSYEFSLWTIFRRNNPRSIGSD